MSIVWVPEFINRALVNGILCLRVDRDRQQINHRRQHMENKTMEIIERCKEDVMSIEGKEPKHAYGVWMKME